MSSPQTTFLCIYDLETRDENVIIKPLANTNNARAARADWEELDIRSLIVYTDTQNKILTHKNNLIKFKEYEDIQTKKTLITCKLNTYKYDNNIADYNTIQPYKPLDTFPIILKGNLNLSLDRQDYIQIQGGTTGHVLGGHLVFIENTDGLIYGPLVRINDNNFNMPIKHIKDLQLPYTHYDDLKDIIFTEKGIDGSDLRYMLKLPDIANWETIDCLLDKDIINEIEKYEKDKHSSSKILYSSSTRMSRADKLINNHKTIQNFIRETFSNKLKKDNLIASVIIDSIKNGQTLDEVIKNEQILTEIIKNQTIKDRFKKENINDDYISEQSSITSEKIQEKDDEITRLQEELKNSKQEISHLNLKYEEQIEYGEAKEELDKLKEEITEKKGVKKHIEEEIDTKRTDKATLDEKLKALKEESKELTKELAEGFSKKTDAIRKEAQAIFPYLNLSTKGSIEPEINKKDIQTYSCHTLEGDASYKRTSIYENVKNFLNFKEYSIDDDDLYNYLICTTQNFLSVLYGEPGVGKTSLVDLVSEALYGQKRFLPISVAKGWTSTEDFIGYYNSLTQKFVASPTGFYNFVNFINESNKLQADSSNNISMAGVLLDEANLSVMEHYWSAFIKDTDKIHENKPIALFSDKFDVPKNLRFIATMNYDHTTEPLSGRILSRCPVIQIKSSKKNYTKTEKPTLYPFAEKDILEAFMYNGTEYDTQLSNKCDEIFNDFTVYFAYNPSPRDRKQILNYVSVASQVLNNATTNSWDYAIAQFILPRLSFKHNESGFEKLESFKNSMSHYENTTKILEEIIEDGKENAYCFSYF